MSAKFHTCFGSKANAAAIEWFTATRRPIEKAFPTGICPDERIVALANRAMTPIISKHSKLERHPDGLRAVDRESHLLEPVRHIHLATAAIQQDPSQHQAYVLVGLKDHGTKLFHRLWSRLQQLL